MEDERDSKPDTGRKEKGGYKVDEDCSSDEVSCNEELNETDERIIKSKRHSYQAKIAKLDREIQNALKEYRKSTKTSGERDEYCKRRNAMYSRRKYYKRKYLANEFLRDKRFLQERNAALKAENTTLETLLKLAQEQARYYDEHSNSKFAATDPEMSYQGRSSDGLEQISQQSTISSRCSGALDPSRTSKSYAMSTTGNQEQGRAHASSIPYQGNYLGQIIGALQSPAQLPSGGQESLEHNSRRFGSAHDTYRVQPLTPDNTYSFPDGRVALGSRLWEEWRLLSQTPRTSPMHETYTTGPTRTPPIENSHDTLGSQILSLLGHLGSETSRSFEVMTRESSLGTMWTSAAGGLPRINDNVNMPLASPALRNQLANLSVLGQGRRNLVHDLLWFENVTAPTDAQRQLSQNGSHRLNTPRQHSSADSYSANVHTSPQIDELLNSSQNQYIIEQIMRLMGHFNNGSPAG